MAFRAARRIALSLAAVAIALSAGLATPPTVAARAACETDTCRLIHDSTSIVLARYRGAAGAFALFDVVDVLKGPSVRTERIRSNYFAPYSPRGRWLFVTNPDFGGMFRVSASGGVADLFGGEGSPNDYPTTLAAWYLALGLQPPDTATAPSAAPPAPTHPPVALLASAGLLGALLALRRASRPAATVKVLRQREKD